MQRFFVILLLFCFAGLGFDLFPQMSNDNNEEKSVLSLLEEDLKDVNEKDKSLDDLFEFDGDDNSVSSTLIGASLLLNFYNSGKVSCVRLASFFPFSERPFYLLFHSFLFYDRA